MVNILKYLRSEGGYISAAMALGSMIMNGVMGSQSRKATNKLFQKSGEENNLQQFTQNWLNRYRGQAEDVKNQGLGGINQGLEAAQAGGLYPAISEAFSQRPNSAELDSIAQQERQLKNQALNTGARGGLLRQQMFEAGKNAATNRMNVMENARQNALQRAFNIFSPMAPTQNADIARQQQLLGYDQLASGNWNNLARMGVDRNLAKAGVTGKSADQSGSGLGTVLGGLFGGGDSGGIGGILGGLFPSLSGPISGAVGGTPTFSLPTAGQGFPSLPFTSLGGGGITGIM